MLISSTVMDVHDVAKFRILEFSPKSLMYDLNYSLLPDILWPEYWYFAKDVNQQSAGLIWFFLLAKDMMSNVFCLVKSLYMFYLRMWCKSHLNFCLSPVTLHFGHNTFISCLGTLDTLGHFFKSVPFVSILSVPNLHQIPFLCELISQKLYNRNLN